MNDERPFRKIIVGSDGAPSGQDALALGGVLGRLGGADLMAIGIYADPMLPFPRHSNLQGVCEQLLRADRDAIAPEARISAIAAPSPASALQHVVEREHADLLVLGSDERAEPGGVRAGRHARQLLHGGPCAVAIAPRGYAALARPPRRIVAGYDGSPEAADAVARARRLAAAADAVVHVLAVVDAAPPTTGGFDAMVYLPEDWEEIAAIRRQEAREQLDELLGGATGLTAELVDGDPALALCEASRRADLLVVGSRHWGPLARLFVGSVAEYVVRHARCPVLVIPRRAATSAAEAREQPAAAAT
jgi:nucleotide-binding universal stress UspA family protein